MSARRQKNFYARAVLFFCIELTDDRGDGDQPTKDKSFASVQAHIQTGSIKVDLAKIKAELEKKLHELEARSQGIEANLSAEPDADWEENAKQHEDDEVLDQLGNITEDEIRHVKLALSRIETGDYGICSSCQGKIGAARLEALPFATQCINCA